jgi:hypothetical protein
VRFKDIVEKYSLVANDFSHAEEVEFVSYAPNAFIQRLDVNESSEYLVEGFSSAHRLFFDSKPYIDDNQFLRVVCVTGEVYYLKAIKTEVEKNPGGSMVMWNTVAVELSNSGLPKGLSDER